MHGDAAARVTRHAGQLANLIKALLTIGLHRQLQLLARPIALFHANRQVAGKELSEVWRAPMAAAVARLRPAPGSELLAPRSVSPCGTNRSSTMGATAAAGLASGRVKLAGSLG